MRSQLAVRRGDSKGNPLTLDEELDKLRAELADISSRDTPRHPDVLRLKRQIADAEALKQQVDAESNSSKRDEEMEIAGRPRTLSELQAISPMLQIEGQIKSNKLEIANRQQEISRLEAQLDAYQSRLNLTPVREQQLAAITRDHEQSRTNYESLLNKKMQSEMATNLEKRQEGEQFRIIDPANFPQKPYFPDRLKFSLLGLILGTGIGAGVTVLVEAMDEQIHSGEDLLTITPVPILVSIPLLQTAEEQSRACWHQRLQTGAALLIFAVIPVVTVLSYYKG